MYMNRKITLMLLLALVCSSQVMAFNEDKFRATLEKLNRTLFACESEASASRANAAGEDFVWLKADKINQQLETLIRGIESAKGVATALAVIVNLYQSDRISVDVALTAIQILKLRAVFLKVFITNGDSELEVMIHVLNEHEADFSEKARLAAEKTSVNVSVQGKIAAPQVNP
jgi:hypothetical protein